MASQYYDNSDGAQRFQPGAIARADEVDAKLDQVAAGFEQAEGDIDRSLKLPASETSQEINATPLQRRRRVVGFDADGNLTLLTGFNWRGDWATATEYFVNDVFRDPATKNIYVTGTRHTSAAALSTDITTGRVELAINVEDVEQLKAETQQIKDDAVSETTAIKNTAVTAANTATTKASEASSSALAASGSASTASTKASEAATSASNAAGSATTASTAANTATTKAGEASTSASNAASSASTANTAAGTATTKAGEASTSASNAASSASTASTAAGTATTKAGEASSSAGAAASSASTATAAANTATTKAGEASTSASNAAATLADFLKRYLGPFEAPPTTDNEGDPLQVGALYYSTVAGDEGMRQWTGTAWENAYATIDGVSWGDISGKPETATRWPAYEEVTDKPLIYTQAEIDTMIGDIGTILDTINGEVV
ncbi:hypothetical protein ACIGG6_02070 [Vreelandella lionensis]|uniref:Tail fiber protein n=1 Tax=Vreelandella lionensis TaxID=1144478 RepID=A0ABW8BNL5_9GAMM